MGRSFCYVERDTREGEEKKKKVLVHFGHRQKQEKERKEVSWGVGIRKLPSGLLGFCLLPFVLYSHFQKKLMSIVAVILRLH